MAASAQTLWLELPGGRHQAVLEKAATPTKGLAYVAHPHPLFGGTMDNKVVQTLSRAYVQSGWDCLRFNFRGVGQSEGVYDEGLGETDDVLAALRQLAPRRPPGFGGFFVRRVCGLSGDFATLAQSALRKNCFGRHRRYPFPTNSFAASVA